MKYRDFLRILANNGFVEKPDKTPGRHRKWEGWVSGQRRMVTVDFSHAGDDITIRNFQSMIKQSGLPKKIFRS